MNSDGLKEMTTYGYPIGIVHAEVWKYSIYLSSNYSDENVGIFFKLSSIIIIYVNKVILL